MRAIGWFQKWLLFDLGEEGQGQTEYMILLSIVVLTVLFVLVGLGFAIYYFYDDIYVALPF